MFWNKFQSPRPRRLLGGGQKYEPRHGRGRARGRARARDRTWWWRSQRGERSGGRRGRVLAVAAGGAERGAPRLRRGPDQIIADQFNKILKVKVIEPIHSAWASPVVIVPKKNGKARFCVDYRRLNNITKKDAYPLPRTEDCLDSLGDAKVFTSLDCTVGYWQVPLRPADREKTAFATHSGIYHWLSMPFGLTNAPASFQRALDIILSGLKWKLCLVYLDDVIIFSASAEQHVKDVDVVLTLFREAGVTLNLEKCT